MAKCSYCSTELERRSTAYPGVGALWCGRCTPPDSARMKARLAEIREGLRSPAPLTMLTLCIGCGDTHMVKNDPDPRPVDKLETPWPEFIPCPICPTPCRDCAGGAWDGAKQVHEETIDGDVYETRMFPAGAGKGAYCKKTPCSCACHGGSKRVKAKPAKTPKLKPAPVRETDADAFERVPDMLTRWRHVIALSKTFAWRWDPIDLEIVSALVHQDGTAALDLVCSSLVAKALANGTGTRTHELIIGPGPRHSFDASGMPKAVVAAVLDLAEHAILLTTGSPPEGGPLERSISEGLEGDDARQWRSTEEGRAYYGNRVAP